MRRLVIGTLAIVVVAAAIVVVALLSTSHGSNSSSFVAPPPQSLPGQVGLSAQAGQLLALLDHGRQQTYHAVYKIEGSATDTGGMTALAVWADGTHIREDSTLQANNSSATVETFEQTAGGTATVCTKSTGPWACHATTESTTQDPFSAAAQELSGKAVTTSTTKVDGYAATCYVVTSGSDTDSICATSAGIPIRLQHGGLILEVATLNHTVSSSDFSPPASNS